MSYTKESARCDTVCRHCMQATAALRKHRGSVTLSPVYDYQHGQAMTASSALLPVPEHHPEQAMTSSVNVQVDQAKLGGVVMQLSGA